MKYCIRIKRDLFSFSVLESVHLKACFKLCFYKHQLDGTLQIRRLKEIAVVPEDQKRGESSPEPKM